MFGCNLSGSMDLGMPSLLKCPLHLSSCSVGILHSPDFAIWYMGMEGLRSVKTEAEEALTS